MSLHGATELAGVDNPGVENAGVENVVPSIKGGKRWSNRPHPGLHVT